MDGDPSTTPQPVGRLASVSLECSDAEELATFYSALLGLQRIFTTPDSSIVALSDGGVAVTMMRVDAYEPSGWPGTGRVHLDVSVTDLDAAVVDAIALGATQHDHQWQPELWRVLLDPAGHPFCLTTVTG